jgi:Orthopoxvirus protein of unknown function (DUF830).
LRSQIEHTVLIFTKKNLFVMKKILIIFGIFILLIFVGIYSKEKFFNTRIKNEIAKKEFVNLTEKNIIQDGDIIFHASLSSQSKAIQLATKSKYSHCGIIYKLNSEYYVFEAVQPVKLTPLDKWIARGKDGEYVIKRLKNANEVLNAETLRKMRTIGESFMGKSYDLTFEWSDEKIYCSELIWKVFHRATGIEIGELEELSDFDLSHKIVQEKMKERYGENIPLNEIVISPKAIFESKLLTTIKEN